MPDLHEKSVTEVLKEALDSFQDAHERFWAQRLPQSEIAVYMAEFGQPEGWYQALNKMAKDAYKLAQHLTGESFLQNYELQQAIEPSPIYLGIPIAALQVQMAREFVYGLEDRVVRVQRIADFAQETPTSPVVQGFLRKLGRCYIAGFDTECAILCRSILETALRDRLQACGVTTGDLKFFELIREAVRIGLVEEQARGGASHIRNAGNRAVHDDPDTTDDVYEIVMMTHDLVRNLYNPEFGGGESDPRPEGPNDILWNGLLSRFGFRGRMAGGRLNLALEHERDQEFVRLLLKESGVKIGEFSPWERWLTIDEPPPAEEIFVSAWESLMQIGEAGQQACLRIMEPHVAGLGSLFNQIGLVTVYTCEGHNVQDRHRRWPRFEFRKPNQAEIARFLLSAGLEEDFQPRVRSAQWGNTAVEIAIYGHPAHDDQERWPNILRLQKRLVDLAESLSGHVDDLREMVRSMRWIQDRLEDGIPPARV